MSIDVIEAFLPRASEARVLPASRIRPLGQPDGDVSVFVSDDLEVIIYRHVDHLT
jgi:hypothetical protein